MGGLAASAGKPVNRPGWGKGKLISDAGSCGGGWWTSVQRLTPHPAPDKQGVRAFIDRVGGRQITCRSSTVVSNSLLHIGHHWSD